MLEMFLISQRSVLSFMQLTVASVFVCLSVAVSAYVYVCVAYNMENIEITIQPRNCSLKRS